MGHGTRVTRVTRNDKPGANLSLSLFATECAVTPCEEQGAEATTMEAAADAKRIAGLARLLTITSRLQKWKGYEQRPDTSADRCRGTKTAVKSRRR